MKRIILATTIAAATLVGPALADPYRIFTVQDFYNYCPTDPSNDTIEDGLQAAVCIGFMDGLSSFLQMNCAFELVNQPFMKADLSNWTPPEMIQAARAWIERTPETLPDISSTLVVALSEVSPCPY